MWKTTVLLIAVLLALLLGCSKEEEESQANPVAPVQVAPVAREVIQRVINANGVIYPFDQAAVTPKISAPVERFLVNRGDHVQQGQLVAVLENRDLAGASAESRGQVAQAEAGYRVVAGAELPEEVVRSQGEVQAAGQALEAAQRLAESRQKLLAEGVIARRLADEAEVAVAQARAQFRTAQTHLKALDGVSRESQTKSAAAQVDAAKGRQESADAQLSYARIRSPISGVVADRPFYAGEMAGAGTPLLTVVDVSRVIARANVPLDEARYIKTGNPATIVAPGDSPIRGKVTVVSPAAETGSTTVQVWVQADNPGERLRPGTAVRVSIVAATLQDAVVVPQDALMPSSESGVAVMAVGPDAIAHQKPVKTGVRDGGKVQIIEGVSPGEQVVVAGGIGLEDGAKVRIEKPTERSEEK